MNNFIGLISQFSFRRFHFKAAFLPRYHHFATLLLLRASSDMKYLVNKGVWCHCSHFRFLSRRMFICNTRQEGIQFCLWNIYSPCVTPLNRLWKYQRVVGHWNSHFTATTLEAQWPCWNIWHCAVARSSSICIAFNDKTFPNSFQYLSDVYYCISIPSFPNSWAF